MEGTYAIVADGGKDAGNITEYQLGDGSCAPGCCIPLTPSYVVNSDYTVNGIRAVNITRPVQVNSSSKYYTFPTQSGSKIPVIWAKGDSKDVEFETSKHMSSSGKPTLILT